MPQTAAVQKGGIEMDSPGRRRRRRPRSPAPAPQPAAATVAVARGVQATGHRLLRAQPASAYGMASRLEHLPRWSDLWMRADTVERRGNRWVLRLRGFVAGLPAESVVRAELEPGRWVQWRQAHGTFLHYAAWFEVAPAEGGEGTVVRYTVELDPGVALLDEASTRRVVVQEVERTLDRMKWSAERELVAEEVRLMKARPSQESGVAAEVPAQPPQGPPRAEAAASTPSELEGAPAALARRKRRRRRTGKRPQTP